MEWWIVIIVSIAIIFIVGNIYTTKARKEYLFNKYNSEEIVENIMQGHFWVGQTSEQLIDSLGKPSDKSIKIMKTRYREIWKYNKTGKNRYGLRITLDDHVVQTWEQK